MCVLSIKVPTRKSLETYLRIFVYIYIYIYTYTTRKKFGTTLHFFKKKKHLKMAKSKLLSSEVNAQLKFYSKKSTLKDKLSRNWKFLGCNSQRQLESGTNIDRKRAELSKMTIAD